MSSREGTFARLVTEAESEPGVLGLFVFGSRGCGIATDEASDYDVAVILKDAPSQSAFDRRWPYRRGADVEVVTATIDDLREDASIGSEREWARYQYVHVEVVIDKTDGDLPRILAAKARIPNHLLERVIRPALGAYLNSTHRSLRNNSVGVARAARLDAAESVPFLLTVIFGLEGQVRPFNKHLEWELQHHPLSNQDWEPECMLTLLDRLMQGDTAAQRELLRRLERAARAGGYGDEFDVWEPDLDWLRGVSDYRL